MAADAIFGAHGRDIGAAEATWSTPHPAGPITFRDVLDALNPLQYVPVVGTIYRVATGDDGSPPLRIAASIIGGAVMGGPVGLLTSIAGALAEHFFPFEHIARSLVAPGRTETAPTHTTAEVNSGTPPPAGPLVAARAASAYARTVDMPARIIQGGGEK